MKKIIILLFTLSLAFFSFGCQKNQGDEFFHGRQRSIC